MAQLSYMWWHEREGWSAREGHASDVVANFNKMAVQSTWYPWFTG